VCFSNRPFGVKHFQTIRHDSVDVAHGLVLLFGIGTTWNEQLRLALHLLLYTGQRVGDVVTMKWSDIADGRITVVQEKAGRWVTIPVDTRLAAMLKEIPRRSDYILNNRWHRPYKNADALSGVIKRVLTTI